VIRSFVKSVNAQDWDSVRKLVVPQFVRHSNAGGVLAVRSAEELITYLKNEYVTSPDAKETLLDLVAEVESVAVRSHFSGTQLGSTGSYPSSGKVLSATYLAICRLEGGRIAEAWAEWDNLYGLHQLGHLKVT
jgi:predicted ester cyclase